MIRSGRPGRRVAAIAATLHSWTGPSPAADQLRDLLDDAGARSVSTWANDAGFRYDWHSHGYHKVLFCVSGSIVFHTRDGDLALGPGDRLDVEPGTDHAATVGPDGVRCIEGSR
ncbi:MAG TPA: AraC family ligand binding domain-containing protein [Acidimicrobiales bacterium]|nr:AraC family ligand binding domain-containing protein [Acidimicrobiales bacterium]